MVNSKFHAKINQVRHVEALIRGMPLNFEQGKSFLTNSTYFKAVGSHSTTAMFAKVCPVRLNSSRIFLQVCVEKMSILIILHINERLRYRCLTTRLKKMQFSK